MEHSATRHVSILVRLALFIGSATKHFQFIANSFYDVKVL